jgi:diguanylate cyclase (GGDEF)-like protein
MDYRTLFIFDIVSLGIYFAVVQVLALLNRRMTGMHWFALSLLLELLKSVLQAGRGTFPTWAATLVPNLLNGLSVGACYLGFHWFLNRKPVRRRAMMITVALMLLIYPLLWAMHSRFATTYNGAPLLSLLTIWMLVSQGRGRFRMAARTAAGLILCRGLVALYRTAISFGAVGPIVVHANLPPVMSDPRALNATFIVMLSGASLLLVYLWFFVIESRRELEDSALRDELTGLLNRRALLRESRREIDRARQTGRPLTLVAIDLDFFKNINDRFGHQAGDNALATFAGLLRSEMREFDLVARYGGEEFFLLLPETTPHGAITVTDKVRAAIRTRPITFAGVDLKLTFTAGITEYLSDDCSFEQMMQRADAALYQGKTATRNCTVVDGVLLRPAGSADLFDLVDAPH